MESKGLLCKKVPVLSQGMPVRGSGGHSKSVGAMTGPLLLLHACLATKERESNYCTCSVCMPGRRREQK